MKQVLYTILIFLLFTANAFAVTISGTVKDTDTGKPLKNIVIGIEELKAVYYTGSSGEFIINNIKPGFYQFYIVHPSYGKKIIKIRVKRNFHIDLELQKLVYNLDKTINNYYIIQDRFGTQSVSYHELKTYPMRGMGDSLHILQALPGVGGTLSTSPVPIIRGSSPLQDKYYIDDIPVDFPYHYIDSMKPIMSSINEEIIDSASIIKGPYPVYYEDSLSSIIQVKTRDVDQYGVHGKVILDPVIPVFPTVMATVAPTRDLSVLFTGRRTYIDKIVESNTTDVSRNFYLQDHYLKATYNLFDSHRIYFISFGSSDVNENVLRKELKSKSKYQADSLKWDFLVQDNLFVKTILSRYEIDHYYKNNRANNYMIFNPQQYRWHQSATYTRKKLHVKGGYEITRHSGSIKSNINIDSITNSDFETYKLILNYLYFSREGSTEEKTEFSGNSYSLFAETGLQLKKYWFNLGARYKYYAPDKSSGFSTRSMAGMYLSQKTALYAGGGIYYSHPDMYYYAGKSDPDLKNSKSYTTTVGIKSNFYQKFTGQVEIYYTRYWDLLSKNGEILNNEIKTESPNNPYAREEDGQSYGIEFYLKGSYKKIQGWISYSLSQSKRSYKDDSNYLSDFDQTHMIRIALQTKIHNVTPALIWHFYSSTPYTPINGSTENNGDNQATFGDYNSERYGPHHRLDLKFTAQVNKNFKWFFELWNYYGGGSQPLYQSFDPDTGYGNANPTTQDELTFFLWYGVEICF